MTQAQPPITVHACHKCHYAVVDGTQCRFCKHLVPVVWEVVTRIDPLVKYQVTTYLPIYPRNINDYVYTKSTPQD
jgi:hypothetical protein